MESCEHCAPAALNYGGDLIPVYISNVRHWKPKNIWKGTTKKIPDTRPVPLFCEGKNSPVLMDSTILINREHHKARDHRSGVPIA